MKTKHILLITASLMLCLYACKKDGSQPSLIGKWNIVSDSTYVGAGLSNHQVDYMGQPGDYFDFTSNGTVYTKEGSILDTLSYNLVSNTEIVIGAFGLIANGVPAISHITNFTSYTINIASPVDLTPGGIFGRKIRLSR